MDFTFRAAKHTDYTAVCALFAEGDRFHSEALPHIFCPAEGPARSREFFARALANNGERLFVAERDGLIIGLLHCRLRNAPDWPGIVPRRWIYLETLVVSEAFRRAGVGSALIERAHAWAGEQKITAVELNVWEFNAGAIKLYEKMGYKTSRRILEKRLEG